MVQSIRNRSQIVIFCMAERKMAYIVNPLQMKKSWLLNVVILPNEPSTLAFLSLTSAIPLGHPASVLIFGIAHYHHNTKPEIKDAHYLAN